MSRWGNNKHNQEPQSPNFQTLLSQTDNVLDLMQTENFLQNVKNNNNNFTQIILLPSHRNTLYQIIDIALNPNQYKNKNNCLLNTTLTNCAIQVLTSLSEEFIQCVFEEGGKKQEDEVVQSSPTFPILEYIFGAILSEGTQDTGFAYLVKLITHFVYQRPQKILIFLNGGIAQGLMNHFGNKSVCELLQKALETEGEDNEFYLSLKLNLVKVICEAIAKQQNQDRFLSLIQSFGDFMEFLVDKHEDKYQKQKYNSFVRSVVARAELFQFLISALSKYSTNHLLKNQILHCLEAYLHIHLPIKQKEKEHSKASNQSNIFINQQIKVNQQFVQRLQESLQTLGLTSFVSDNRGQLVSYYKLIKNLIIAEPTLIPTILTEQFIDETLKIMQNDPDNNILHNYQKDVLVEAVHKSPEVLLLLKNHFGFQSILRNNLTPSLNKTSYESQLFLIAEIISNKTEEQQTSSDKWIEIKTIIQSKRKLYSTVIGGGPHTFNQGKWDDLEDENVKEEVIQIYKGKPTVSYTPNLDQLSGNEVLSNEGDKREEEQDQKNEHYFDFELPFDSDREDQKESVKEIQSNKVLLQSNSLVQIAVDPQLLQTNSQKQVVININPPDEEKPIPQSQQKQKQTEPVQEITVQTKNHKVTFQETNPIQVQPNTRNSEIKKTSFAEVLVASQVYSEDYDKLQDDDNDKHLMLKGSMVDSQLWQSKDIDEEQPSQKLIEFMEFIPLMQTSSKVIQEPVNETLLKDNVEPSQTLTEGQPLSDD